MATSDPKTVRGRLRLTQTEIAIKAGVSISTIQIFERGKLKPEHVTARRLADAYGKSVEWVERACAERATSAA